MLITDFTVSVMAVFEVSCDTRIANSLADNNDLSERITGLLYLRSPHACTWHLNVPVMFVHVATYYLVCLFCPHAWRLLLCLTDCLVGRTSPTSPTSPCPPFGWLPSWVSTRFERWWEWKHIHRHTPSMPRGLHPSGTAPSNIFPTAEVIHLRGSKELSFLNIDHQVFSFPLLILMFPAVVPNLPLAIQ